MSSRNRERKAANREKRAAHEEAMRRRARRQRWIFGIGGLLLAGIIAFVVVSNLGDDDDNQVVADDADTEGTECVPVADPLPEGAPEVPVQVGAPPTELVIEDLVVGDGTEVTADAQVTVNYVGVACTTGAIFDESYSREPATFALNAVIPGWTEGLQGMKVGGQRLLGIPAEMAYGETGQGELIGPNEPLWFVVDMIDVQPSAPAETTTPVSDTTPTT